MNRAILNSAGKVGEKKTIVGCSRLAVCNQLHHYGNAHAMWDHKCYLPFGRGDSPAFTLAKAGTQFSDPTGMQSTVDLCYVKVTNRGLNLRPITASATSYHYTNTQHEAGNSQTARSVSTFKYN